MNYFFLLVAVLTSIYAFTFARWLRKKGNIVGAAGVCILIAISLALPVYRMMSND